MNRRIMARFFTSGLKKLRLNIDHHPTSAFILDDDAPFKVGYFANRAIDSAHTAYIDTVFEKFSNQSL